MKNIIPKIGHLYKFRTDNINLLTKKYNYYYTGLVMCIHEDVAGDIKDLNDAKNIIEFNKKNPIYGFETYNCIQYYENLLVPDEGIKAADVLFFTFKEFNDMLEPARAD